MYALRRLYGLAGEEPSGEQVTRWTEQTNKLIETGTKPAEAGLVAARLEFETLGSELRVEHITVEDVLAMIADEGSGGG